MEYELSEDDEENYTRTYTTTPYGFVPRGINVYATKHCNLQAVTFNSKTREHIILDSRGVSSWARGVFDDVSKRLLEFKSYEINVLRDLVFCRALNLYFALSKEYTLKVFTLNFLEISSRESDGTTISCILLNEKESELIAIGRTHIRIWKFYAIVTGFNQQGLMLETEFQTPEASVVSNGIFDEQLQRLYVLCDYDVYCYDCEGHNIFHLKSNGSMYLSTCAYSIPANLVVTGSLNGQIHIFSPTGGLVTTLLNHTRTVTAIHIHPQDGNMFISSSMDGTVKLFSLHLLEELYSINVFTEGIHWMKLQSNNMIYCASLQAIQLYDLNYSFKFWSTVRCGVKSLSMSNKEDNKSSHIVACGVDHSVRIYNKHNGHKKCTILPPPELSSMETVLSVAYDRVGRVMYIMFSSDVLWVYSLRTDPATRVTMWNIIRIIEQYKSKHEIDVEKNANSFGKSSVSLSQAEDNLTCNCIASLPREKPPEKSCEEKSSLHFNYLLCGMSNGTVYYVDPTVEILVTKSFKAHLNSPVEMIDIYRGANGIQIFTLINTLEGFFLKIWYSEFLTCLYEINIPQNFTALSMKSMLFVVGSDDGKVQIERYDNVLDIQESVTSLTEVAPSQGQIKDHNGPVISVDILEHKQLVCSCGNDQYIRLWNCQKVLLHEIKFDSTLCGSTFVDKTGTILFGFKSQLFIIPVQILQLPTSEDSASDTCTDESFVYEDPYVRRDIGYRLKPTTASTLDNYLVPYPHLELKNLWLFEQNLEQALEEISEAEDDGESSEEYSIGESCADTEVYQTEYSSFSRSTSEMEFPICGADDEWYNFEEPIIASDLSVKISTSEEHIEELSKESIKSLKGKQSLHDQPKALKILKANYTRLSENFKNVVIENVLKEKMRKPSTVSTIEKKVKTQRKNSKVEVKRSPIRKKVKKHAKARPKKKIAVDIKVEKVMKNEASLANENAIIRLEEKKEQTEKEQTEKEQTEKEQTEKEQTEKEQTVEEQTVEDVIPMPLLSVESVINVPEEIIEQPLPVPITIVETIDEPSLSEVEVSSRSISVISDRDSGKMENNMLMQYATGNFDRAVSTSFRNVMGSLFGDNEDKTTSKHNLLPSRSPSATLELSISSSMTNKRPVKTIEKSFLQYNLQESPDLIRKDDQNILKVDQKRNVIHKNSLGGEMSSPLLLPDNKKQSKRGTISPVAKLNSSKVNSSKTLDRKTMRSSKNKASLHLSEGSNPSAGKYLSEGSDPSAGKSRGIPRNIQQKLDQRKAEPEQHLYHSMDIQTHVKQTAIEVTAKSPTALEVTFKSPTALEVTAKSPNPIHDSIKILPNYAKKEVNQARADWKKVLILSKLSKRRSKEKLLIGQSDSYFHDKSRRSNNILDSTSVSRVNSNVEVRIPLEQSSDEESELEYNSDSTKKSRGSLQRVSLKSRAKIGIYDRQHKQHSNDTVFDQLHNGIVGVMDEKITQQVSPDNVVTDTLHLDENMNDVRSNTMYMDEKVPHDDICAKKPMYNESVNNEHYISRGNRKSLKEEDIELTEIDSNELKPRTTNVMKFIIAAFKSKEVYQSEKSKELKREQRKERGVSPPLVRFDTPSFHHTPIIPDPYEDPVNFITPRNSFSSCYDHVTTVEILSKDLSSTSNEYFTNNELIRNNSVLFEKLSKQRKKKERQVSRLKDRLNSPQSPARLYSPQSPGLDSSYYSRPTSNTSETSSRLMTTDSSRSRIRISIKDSPLHNITSQEISDNCSDDSGYVRKQHYNNNKRTPLYSEKGKAKPITRNERIKHLEQKLSGQRYRFFLDRTEKELERDKVTLMFLKSKQNGLAILPVDKSSVSIPKRQTYPMIESLITDVESEPLTKRYTLKTIK